MPISYQSHRINRFHTNSIAKYVPCVLNILPWAGWGFSKLASIVQQVHRPVVEEHKNHQPDNDNHPVGINSAWW